MTRPLWNTQNDLAEKVRTGPVELLNQQLADALDLALQAKQAHWNIKGPSFIARTTAKKSRLSEYPLGIHSGHEHVTALSGAIATFGASVRAGIDAATDLGDADTTDLFTEISRSVDKLPWKVEAHGQGKD
jgi:starvation-inducible DNA-binding protein